MKSGLQWNSMKSGKITMKFVQFEIYRWNFPMLIPFSQWNFPLSWCYLHFLNRSSHFLYKIRRDNCWKSNKIPETQSNSMESTQMNMNHFQYIQHLIRWLIDWSNCFDNWIVSLWLIIKYAVSHSNGCFWKYSMQTS